MYMNLSKSWLKANEKKMIKEANDNFSKEDNADDILLDSDVKSKVRIEEFSDGKLIIDADGDFGYLSFEVGISDDLAFEIINHMKCKGEKIVRLVKLCENEG